MAEFATTTIPDATAHDEAIDALDRTPGFAGALRNDAASTMRVLDQAAIYADAALPDRDVARRLNFDYSTQQALTEINGAKVRILASLDDIEGIPDDDLVSDGQRIRWFDACKAGWDLVLKIQQKAEAAPGALDRVKGGLGVGAGSLGDIIGDALKSFLDALAKNLWVWLLVAGVVVAVIVIKPWTFFRAAVPA